LGLGWQRHGVRLWSRGSPRDREGVGVVEEWTVLGWNVGQGCPIVPQLRWSKVFLEIKSCIRRLSTTRIYQLHWIDIMLRLVHYLFAWRIHGIWSQLGWMGLWGRRRLSIAVVCDLVSGIRTSDSPSMSEKIALRGLSSRGTL